MGKGRSIVHVDLKPIQSRRSGAEEWQERMANRKALQARHPTACACAAPSVITVLGKRLCKDCYSKMEMPDD